MIIKDISITFSKYKLLLSMNIHTVGQYDPSKRPAFWFFMPSQNSASTLGCLVTPDVFSNWCRCEFVCSLSASNAYLINTAPQRQCEVSKERNLVSIHCQSDRKTGTEKSNLAKTKCDIWATNQRRVPEKVCHAPRRKKHNDDNKALFMKISPQRWALPIST